MKFYQIFLSPEQNVPITAIARSNFNVLYKYN